MKTILEIIFKVGALAGLVGIVYQIHNNRKNRPCLKFIFEGSSATKRSEDKLEYCTYTFKGILVNASLSPNSIIRLYLTVWDNKKKNSILRFGHQLKDLADVNTGRTVYLPLLLNSKEARRVNINFDFVVTGTQDFELLSAVKKVGDNIYLPKYQYEFFIEDSNGNLFDYKSSIISRELIDLWWTLPNYSKKPIKYLKQLAIIFLAVLKSIFAKIRTEIGFYK